jgi:hypothetical protein
MEIIILYTLITRLAILKQTYFEFE